MFEKIKNFGKEVCKKLAKTMAKHNTDAFSVVFSAGYIAIIVASLVNQCILIAKNLTEYKAARSKK